LLQRLLQFGKDYTIASVINLSFSDFVASFDDDEVITCEDLEKWCEQFGAIESEDSYESFVSSVTATLARNGYDTLSAFVNHFRTVATRLISGTLQIKESMIVQFFIASVPNRIIRSALIAANLDKLSECISLVMSYISKGESKIEPATFVSSPAIEQANKKLNPVFSNGKTVGRQQPQQHVKGPKASFSESKSNNTPDDSPYCTFCRKHTDHCFETAQGITCPKVIARIKEGKWTFGASKFGHTRDNIGSDGKRKNDKAGK
jgi:hypothetical protein